LTEVSWGEYNVGRMEKMDKRKQVTSILSVFFLIITFFQWNLFAQETLQVPTVEFVCRAYEYQSSLIKNIAFEVKCYLNLDSFNKNFKKVPAHKHIKILRKSGKELKEEIINFSNFSRLDKKNFEKKLYDKNTGIVKVLGYTKKVSTGEIVFPPGLEGIISTNQKYPFTYRAGYYADIGAEISVWDKPLLTRLKEGNATVLREPRKVNGNICWIVTGRGIESPDKIKYEIWVDPKIGLMPRIIKEIGGSVYHERKYLNYKEVYPGVWFPIRVEVESYPSKNKNVYIVDHVKVNSPLPEKLQLDFPSGTLVKDEITGVEFKVK